MRKNGPLKSVISNSCSCPFPLGFGLCVEGNHVHNNMIEDLGSMREDIECKPSGEREPITSSNPTEEEISNTGESGTDEEGYCEESKIEMVRNLCKKQRVDLIALVETKSEEVSRVMVARLWGRWGPNWEIVGEINQSRGIRSHYGICVIYALQLSNENALLWEELTKLKKDVRVPILFWGD
ncbi:hypothetical protein PIB30_076252 [Stylosanthes scabra]|uniref:Uncharacterized protein n=1 Tax=Stylosanthes scabra TaxID=79078 RepID=A0ABU6TQM9_9FABA|nr:hypothetical protein [Stylosanthes scabra]